MSNFGGKIDSKYFQVTHVEWIVERMTFQLRILRKKLLQSQYKCAY